MKSLLSVLLFSATLLSGCAYSPSDTTPNEFVQEGEPYPLPAKNAAQENNDPWAALPPRPAPENPPEDPILPPGEVNIQPKNPNERTLTPHCHPDVPGSCI